VTEARREAALRAINASLGRGLAPEDVPRFRARSFCPELQKSAAVLDLFRGTGVAEAAAALVAPESLEPVTTGQIALSFPVDASGSRRAHPHIDGLYTPENGVPKGSVLSFTMLAGVVLGAAPTAGGGHLVVWPGSHLALERHFRARGPKSLLEGMPDVDLGRPEEVVLRAGDAILCHYQLAHAGGENASADIRYAVYFRLKRKGHDAQRWECLTDVWREWPLVRGRLSAP
jgi:ectoine hydroxylase-related dioxygenase (phytanoyl-CoA dioxygenase family)